MENNRRPWDVSTTEWNVVFSENEAARRYDLELSEKLAAQWAAEDAAEMAQAA